MDNTVHFIMCPSSMSAGKNIIIFLFYKYLEEIFEMFHVHKRNFRQAALSKYFRFEWKGDLSALGKSKNYSYSSRQRVDTSIFRFRRRYKKRWTSSKFPDFIQCFPDFSQRFPDFSLTKFFKVRKCERCGSLNLRLFRFISKAQQVESRQ